MFKQLKKLTIVMRKLQSILMVICTLMVSNLMAQELPQPSPAASFKQRVGLTDISMEYSRPSVKGRTIWGDLVPYDKVWRAGANKNTMITFSDDVKVGGKEVKAGTYSVFITPGKDNWTVALNTNTELWGADGYETKDDAVSISVRPKATEHVESLKYSIEDLSDNSAMLVMSWEKMALPIKIEVDVQKKAMANIEEALKDDRWRAYRSAANYLADNKIDLPKAKEYIAKSIELNENWYSYWVQADILAATGDKKGAIKSAKKSIELGEASYKERGRDFGYKKDLEDSIAKWSKK